MVSTSVKDLRKKINTASSENIGFKYTITIYAEHLDKKNITTTIVKKTFLQMDDYVRSGKLFLIQLDFVYLVKFLIIWFSLYQFAAILSKDWISTKKSTKRRYRKGNTGQSSRRNFPNGYDDDDDSPDHSNSKIQADTIPNKIKKKLKKDKQKKVLKVKQRNKNIPRRIVSTKHPNTRYVILCFLL